VAQTGLFVEEARWQRLVRRWETLATRYAGWPGAIVYDLLDRPDPPDDLSEATLQALGAARRSFAAARRAPVPGATAGRAWSALALRLTQAVRTVDRSHGIVVQAGRADPATFAHLRPTRDANTLYSCHCFEPRAFTMQAVSPLPLGEAARSAGEGSAQLGSPHPSPRPLGEGAIMYPGTIDGERWDRQRLQRWLQPALDFAATYEVPLYLGAFGVSAAAHRQSQLTWLRTVLGLCHVHGIGWAYWTYRAVPDAPFGVVCDVPPWADRPQFQNPQRLDYDLLGILQSEA
jgi:hypothetical protein